MARHLYIAGKDRWRDYERKTMQIEAALTYQIDTCRFQVRGERPVEGEEVIIEDDALGRLFAGIIVKVELARELPDKSNRLWQVDCDDYTALLDRRLVVESYENMSASDIFLDIVAKYCPGFTVNGVRSGAPVVEATGTEFEYKWPSECFKWLCDYVGWHWQPDYYKDLQFFSTEELDTPAPMALTPGGKFRFGKPSANIQGLRNRVYVRGGTMLSDPQVVQWKADGVARIWTLPWGPHEISLKVADVAKTVGVENLHDEADYDYMMSFTEKYIRCSSQTTTPVAGATIALTAKQDIPVITVVEDYDSQAALAKVQDGDGVYEHIITDDSLTTIQAAEAAGLADLREHANPRVRGSFETEYFIPAVYEDVYTDGTYFLGAYFPASISVITGSKLVQEAHSWHPGQIVNIRLPDRGVEGEFLIQRVTITPVTPKLWTFKVEYGGRLLGIADFLKALVSAQQEKRNIEPAQSVQKFIYGEEALSLSDELILTTRALPYICGDADAICGLVVVSDLDILGWQEEIAQTVMDLEDSSSLTDPLVLCGQKFTATAGMNGTIRIKVHVPLWFVDGPSVKFYIYDDENGYPGASICAPTLLSSSGMPSGEWVWVDVVINLAEPLQLGNVYYLVLQGQREINAPGPMSFFGYGVNTSYSGGHVYDSSNGGASWYVYTNLDYTFKIDAPIYG